MLCKSIENRRLTEVNRRFSIGFRNMGTLPFVMIKDFVVMLSHVIIYPFQKRIILE